MFCRVRPLLSGEMSTSALDDSAETTSSRYNDVHVHVHVHLYSTTTQFWVSGCCERQREPAH